MNRFQKWNGRRRRKKLNEALSEYNEAVQLMCKGARKLLNASIKASIDTPKMIAAVMQIEKVAKHVLITEEDLRRGANNLQHEIQEEE